MMSHRITTHSISIFRLSRQRFGFPAHMLPSHSHRLPAHGFPSHRLSLAHYVSFPHFSLTHGQLPLPHWFPLSSLFPFPVPWISPRRFPGRVSRSWPIQRHAIQVGALIVHVLWTHLISLIMPRRRLTRRGASHMVSSTRRTPPVAVRIGLLMSSTPCRHSSQMTARSPLALRSVLRRRTALRRTAMWRAMMGRAVMGRAVFGRAPVSMHIFLRRPPLSHHRILWPLTMLVLALLAGRLLWVV
jgi:hypothetical protein